MSFKSILRYMKEQFWSVCWKAFGSKLLSQRAVDDRSLETIDDSTQSCWAYIPPELFTEVIMRVEALEMETYWSFRKYVVSCAGVCRSWRKYMKEIVKTPLLSGMPTFPISLKQPSVGYLTRWVIWRDIDNEIYHLRVKAPHLQGKILLAAKRVCYDTCIEYIISLNYKDISKGSSSYVGTLRSNFFGTKFTLYDAHPPNAANWPKVPTGSYPVCSISYKVNALGNRGPSQIQCEINTIPANSFSLPPLIKLKDVELELSNCKRPTWDSQLWCRCLNFIGRETFSSVTKFTLVDCLDNKVGMKEHENIILMFERFDDKIFRMNFQYPISAFQAFAICLSTFDTKVACE